MDYNNLCSISVLLSGINCGPPPPIQNGIVQYSDTNGMAEYKCNEGFLLVGSSTMVRQSAKWTSLDITISAPVCRCMLLFDVHYNIFWVEMW